MPRKFWRQPTMLICATLLEIVRMKIIEGEEFLNVSLELNSQSGKKGSIGCIERIEAGKCSGIVPLR